MPTTSTRFGFPFPLFQEEAQNVAVAVPYEIGTVQTTNATVTTLGTITPLDGTAIIVKALVTARRDTGAEAAGYELTATFRRTGGTTTQVGTTTAVATHEDVAGWDATLDASGTDVRIRVTGVAAVTIDWTGYATVIQAP